MACVWMRSWSTPYTGWWDVCEWGFLIHALCWLMMCVWMRSWSTPYTGWWDVCEWGFLIHALCWLMMCVWMRSWSISCTSQWHVCVNEGSWSKAEVWIMLKKAKEFSRPIYICFIDLKKAYDSLNLEALWTKLQYLDHLPTKLIAILRAMHEDSSAAVKSYGKTSDEFAVVSGRAVCWLPPSSTSTLMLPYVWL